MGVALAGQLAMMSGQLAESQARAQSLAEALEEKELLLASLGREMEALRDAQGGMDAEAQQRELARAEAERRAAILGEQRAVWGSLQAVARHVQSSERQQALARLEQMESAGRQAISEAAEQAAGLGRGVLQGLQGLLARSHSEAAFVAAAQAEQEAAMRLECDELEQRLAMVQAEREGLAQQQAEAGRQAGCHEMEQQEALARLELVAEQSAEGMAIALFWDDGGRHVRDHLKWRLVDRPSGGMEGKTVPKTSLRGRVGLHFDWGKCLFLCTASQPGRLICSLVSAHPFPVC